jgi:hypothetical protein
MNACLAFPFLLLHMSDVYRIDSTVSMQKEY